MVVALKRIAFYVGLVAIWQALYASGRWSPMLFPSPGDVWSALLDGFRQGTFPTAIKASLQRVVIGFIISFFLGVLMGTAMARWKSVQETLGSLVLGMQSLPSICWAPLALMWFGLQDTAILLVVVLGSTFSVTEATYAGFRNVPPLYRRAAMVMGATQMQLLRRVLIPAALPSIVTGLKLSWSFAWRSLMAGELIASLGGFGQLLQNFRETFDMPSVVAVMVVIVAIGLLVNAVVFRPLEKSIQRRWGITTDDRQSDYRKSRRPAASIQRQLDIAQ
ncbi:MAG: TauC [Chloroflexi bacterium]|nr:TauC [Chloroflexota bacterium]MDB5076161.1 TauC [Chloroflexota bacterium]